VQNVPFSGSLFTEEDIEGAEALTQTSFTHRAVSAGAGQIFTSYGVYASTAAGRSAVVKLPLFPVGSSYATPWRESFAGGRFSSLMRSETVAYQQIATSWDVYTDAALADVKSVDGDNGFIVMAGSAQGDCARLYSGKINLEGVVAPALTFYLYNNSGNIVNNNLIEVYACGDDGSGFSYVGGTTVSSLPVPGWNRVTVPLVGFAGATMQFALQGTLESYNTIFVDDIRIASRADRDMAATALVMPGNVVAGVPFEIVVVVENRGARAASGWSVTLSRDGVDVATVDGSVLAAGNTRAVAIADCIGVLNDAGKAVYTASVSYEDDANESDNCTDAVELTFE
ncbi:MAG: hypothetical protein K2O10_02865, partial [Muribaculaceae bacterium]|nr:hypothetical protein [Muribaculaceae bacterium]